MDVDATFVWVDFPFQQKRQHLNPGSLLNWADGGVDGISPARQIPSNILGGQTPIG